MARARIREVLTGKLSLPLLISVNPDDPLVKAIRLMHVYSISQLPVTDGGEVVGTVNEDAVMKNLHKGADFQCESVSAVMSPPLPQLDEDAEVVEAYRVFESGVSAIVVVRQQRVVGLITRSDLIAFWSIGSEPHSYHI
jgi:cystathionine beta-synthase